MRTKTQHGMTILELMVVLAIIGGLIFIARSGFRVLTRADLVEGATDLTSLFKEANELAIEHGELHRVVIDLDTQIYVLEVCQGQTAIARNESVHQDAEETKRALDRGKTRMDGLPQDSFAGDPNEATKRALALAGQHVADRTCAPASDALSGDSSGKGWVRHLPANKGVKFKEVYVQHRDDAVTKGQVAIYFFPQGSSEKALVEVTDDSDDIFTVYVYGLTGRVELHDGAPHDVNDHMLRNAMGDRDAKRESER
jgi:prepilin-type N-terminal cleavage/methylation domain-containing protein